MCPRFDKWLVHVLECLHSVAEHEAGKPVDQNVKVWIPILVEFEHPNVLRGVSIPTLQIDAQLVECSAGSPSILAGSRVSVRKRLN